MANRHVPSAVRKRFLAEAAVMRRAKLWKPYVLLAFGPERLRRLFDWHYRNEPRFHHGVMVFLRGGTSDWRRRVAAHLRTHGYQGKQRRLHRKVANLRERDEELSWLGRFNRRTLPAREASAAPGRSPRVSIWTDVDAIASSKVAWRELVLGTERRARVGTWEILANMMVIVEPDGDVRRSTFVQFTSRQAAPTRSDLLRLKKLVDGFVDYETYLMTPTYVVLCRDSSGRADFDDARRKLDAWFRKLSR